MKQSRKILATRSGHYLLGSIDAQAGLYESARQRLEHCVTLGAEFPEAYIHLGNVYRLTGDFARAAKSYRKAVDLQPLSPLAHYNLALIARQEGAAEQVLHHLGYAQQLPETRGEVLWMRTQVLLELARYDDALESAERAVKEDASYESWHALGYAYQTVHRPAQALQCYEGALAIRSGDAEFLKNHGIVLQELGRIHDAIEKYDAALKIKPGDPLASFHKALIHLLIGEYQLGWPGYEARLVSTEHPARPIRATRWNGENLKGKTILAYGEQGLGDEIMFASCLKDLINEGGSCIIECSPKLVSLFSRSFQRQRSMRRNPKDDRLRNSKGSQWTSRWLSAASLCTTVAAATLSADHKGYLVADPARVEAWHTKLKALGSGLKIGLSWQGGTHKTRNPIRSIALERWMPILNTPDVQFVSLQYTPDASNDIAALYARHRRHDYALAGCHR